VFFCFLQYNKNNLSKEMNKLKKENKRKKEIIDSAIIKLEKKHMLDRIKEKAIKEELTKDERIILIENIYNNYDTKRRHLLKIHKLSYDKKREIDRISYYVLNAIDNALDNKDIESMIVLINQNDLFNEYYEVITNRNRIEEKFDLAYEIRKNNELVKTK